MSIVIDFHPETGHLPPGRFSLSPDHAKTFLVDSDRFKTSRTRKSLWDNLQTFLSQFVWLENNNLHKIPGPLLDRIWLGGSFVSTKTDPRNIDVTVFLHGQAREALKGLPGAGIMTKSRKKWEKELNISPLFVEYHPAGKVFELDALTSSQHEYMASRGRWDDWWQRIRKPGHSAPSIETARPKRGYLEVSLDD